MAKTNKKKGILIIGIIAIIIIFILIILKFKNYNNKFLGIWISEGGTIYEFKEKNKGIMKTSISEYKFTYNIKNDIISIDFEDSKVIDTDYRYSFQKNNKCIMKSDRGTFVFSKK